MDVKTFFAAIAASIRNRAKDIGAKFPGVVAKLQCWWTQIKRVLPDCFVFFIIGGAILLKLYNYVSEPAQVIMLKMLLLSCGFLHAHITRKVAFPEIDWTDGKFTPLKALVIALYLGFIYGYSQGG